MPRRMSAEALEKRLNRAVVEQRASCLKAVWSSETPEVDTQAPTYGKNCFSKMISLANGKPMTWKAWLGRCLCCKAPRPIL